MYLVALDFETYYDKNYILSKLTTEEYVRHPDFEAIGVGIVIVDLAAKKIIDRGSWHTGSNIRTALEAIDWNDAVAVAHNAHFDGAILTWHYGINPRKWMCTLSMSHPLHGASVGGSLARLSEHYGVGVKGKEVILALGKRLRDFTPDELHRYGKYCVNDTALCLAILLKMLPHFNNTELAVIDTTIRMYTEPTIDLDIDLLQQHLIAVKHNKDTLLQQSGYDQETIMSNEKFGEALRSLGVEVPTKISARTGKVAYAFAKTDKGLTDLLTHNNILVSTLVEARLGVKSTIEETRTQNFIGVASRGKLPIMLNYYGAHTGRFSGGDKLNLQNLPKRGNSKVLRQALKAPPGYTLIGCDSSQIEARIVGWVSGQDDLVQAFREQRDVYCEFASDVYGRTVTKADKTERFVGKTAVLSLGYGSGAAKFKEMLRIQGGVDIDHHEAERIVRIYRQKNFKVTRFWNLCNNMLSDLYRGVSGYVHPQVRYENNALWLPSGLPILYPGLKQNMNGFTYQRRRSKTSVEDVKIYGGMVVENIVQALAALVIREQMAEIAKYYKVVLQVHDEIVIIAPSEEAEQAQNKLIQIMSTPPSWAPDLPIACEAGHAANYGDI
jgi:DNA polymerase